jgi:hypothetical protein
MVANAGFLTADGDFGLQTCDQPTGGPYTYGFLGTPWFGSAWVGNTDEPSPFTHVFAANSIGCGMDRNFGRYIAQTSTTNTASTATGNLYVNFDFKNTSAGADLYDMMVSKGANPTDRTLGLYINDSGFYAESSSGRGDSLFAPVTGTWYNVQLALNLDTDTYSGVITAIGGSTTAISERSFVQDKDIDTIFFDTPWVPNTGSGAAPGHRIDNFVLSTTPFAPAPTPEPGAIVLLSTGLFGLLAYAWRKHK